jgi:hypothetical protein
MRKGIRVVRRTFALLRLVLDWKPTNSPSRPRKALQSGSFLLGTSAFRAASLSEENDVGKGGTLLTDNLEDVRSVEMKLRKEVDDEFRESRFRFGSLLFLPCKYERGLDKGAGVELRGALWPEAEEPASPSNEARSSGDVRRGGLAAVGGGTVTIPAASATVFFVGDQLRFRCGDLLSFRVGDVGLDEVGAHDLRARVRMVPATDRPRPRGCLSFSSAGLVVSWTVGSSSSAGNEKRALAIFRFAFLETRLNNSKLAEWTLSLGLTLTSEGKEIILAENVRFSITGSTFSLSTTGKHVKLAERTISLAADSGDAIVVVALTGNGLSGSAGMAGSTCPSTIAATAAMGNDM